jgi:hypothetical protein
VSLLVVLGVSLLVFLYVKSTRQARSAWLAKLDLPGNWHADNADADRRRLTLQGRLDAGEFVLIDHGDSWRGAWRLQGHTLFLHGAGREQRYDLHFFKPGNIGLEEDGGVRHLFSKEATNVIALHTDRKSSE